jgi:hypothetical protein
MSSSRRNVVGIFAVVIAIFALAGFGSFALILLAAKKLFGTRA